MAPPAHRPTCWQLAVAFGAVGATGFGGVLPWARRMVVDQRHWLTDREFAELLPLAQLLPGPNVANIATVLGRRFQGPRGAAAAVAGLYFCPTIVIILIGFAYARWGQTALVQHLLSGLMPAATGLVIATALRLLAGLQRHWSTLTFAATTFIGSFVFGLPLLLVLGVLGPCAVLAAHRLARLRQPAP
ncbi:chromate transporter [Pandoraea communis]|uniref:Putative chromate transport protein n=1 Tax=Pandoraea communis TaxID=2508297 RepID=A0A5E4TYY4_9BURK|nr:chromate transporter [Pandoraea communis]MDM8355105.1 chromate transporter [Pandoraea communis]VVD93070.1 putative chromate transport protein [Pandoraea communis]